MIVALFDADGTLYSAHYGQGLMKYTLAHGRRLHAAAYFASLVPMSLPVVLKLTDSEAFDREIIGRMAWLLRGWTEDQGRAAFQWVTDEYLLPTGREPVLARLKWHQQEGHRVIIASGTFTPSLRLLGERLQVSDLIGTGIELRGGRFTGRSIPPIIKGADKLSQIRAHIAEHDISVDWPSSYAYGDSFSDREFMQLVGHPVAVYPEAKLRELALSRNWEILETGAVE